MMEVLGFSKIQFINIFLHSYGSGFCLYVFFKKSLPTTRIRKYFLFSSESAIVPIFTLKLINFEFIKFINFELISV